MGKRNYREAMSIEPEVLAALPPAEEVVDVQTLPDLRRAWAATWRAIKRKQISRDEASLELYGLQVGTPIFNAEEQARHNAALEDRIERVEQALRAVNTDQSPRVLHLEQGLDLQKVAPTQDPELSGQGSES